MSGLLDGMNPPQREAAGIIDGAVLVLAGAGSGKTRVLTRRIANLVQHGVRPGQILALTFTNKAAGEMKERVSHLMPDPEQARRLTVTTFHSACVRFLREDIEVLGYNRQFAIYDDDDQKNIFKAIFEEMHLGKELPIPTVRAEIDSAKNKMLGPEDLAREERYPPDHPVPEIYRRYQAAMKANNAVDFNDLINLTVRLWEDFPDILAKYRNRYRYLLVDEYQDTNLAQLRLVQLLAAHPDHGNVMVVGDDDQSIYGFRGADIRNILDFQKSFPQAQIIRLEQNYRSRGRILDAANAVVRNNRQRMDKTLWTEQVGGELLSLLQVEDEAAEADQISASIRQHREEGRKWSDFAVIYRTNAASRAFEVAFTRDRIPHVLVGARKFYDRREVKDVLAYLKLVTNPADSASFIRAVNTPRRGIGPKAMEDLRARAEEQGIPLLQAARQMALGSTRVAAGLREFTRVIDTLTEALADLPPEALVDRVLNESGYRTWLNDDDPDNVQERLANLQELSSALADDSVGENLPEEAGPLERLQHFLDRAVLSGQADELPDADDQGRVTLLTAHLAKGLEYPIVYVVGMSEGGFPHYRARDSESDIEEERRLVYVAFTRAMEKLTLTRARMRFLPAKGVREETEPSRFLKEIPRELIKIPGSGGFSPWAPTEAPAARAARLGIDPQAVRPSLLPQTREAPRPTRRAEPEALPPIFPQGSYRTRTPRSFAEFSLGRRVLHSQFGIGTIQKREGSDTNLKLWVSFDGPGVKTLFARHAHLELFDE